MSAYIINLVGKWRVGCHTGYSGCVAKVVEESIKAGMYSTQFFMGNPKSFNRSICSDDSIKHARAMLKRFPMDVFTHFPYIANLNGSKNSLAWNGDSVQDGKTRAMLRSLELELDAVAQLSTDSHRGGVVIHPGNYTDRAVGCAKIAETINMIDFSHPRSRLILENSAGQGTSLATTFEEIRSVLYGLTEEVEKHVGVCVDTAHIYGYGLYDLSNVEQVRKMFKDFDEVIGLGKLSLIHLNDSAVPLGCKKDRHAAIGTGLIWSDNLESLGVLLDFAASNNIPVILETTKSDVAVVGYLAAKYGVDPGFL